MSEIHPLEFDKLVRIEKAATIISNDYWKYINEDTARKELRDALNDYHGANFHYCPDFDHLRICIHDPEWELCTCDFQKTRK